MRHKQYQYIDPSVLLRSVADDIESFRALSTTFLAIAPPMLERLERALLAGDSKAALHESHALKGTASLVGAAQLAGMLQHIESRSRNGEQDRLVQTIPELGCLFRLVTQEVEISLVHFQGEAGHNQDSTGQG